MTQPYLSRLLAFFLTLLFAGVAPLRAANIVVMIGEDEYRTWESLPEFVKSDLEPAGYHVTIIQADAKDKNQFPGLIEALKDADLLFVSVRRRTIPKEQLDAVREHVTSGKPLMGIRTASHAFSLLPKHTLDDPALAIWPEFDHEVLGGNYTGHFAREPAAVSIAPGQENHPIVKGIDFDGFIAIGGLYRNTPLQPTATALLIGTAEGPKVEPIAWTHLYGPNKARVFYTSMGHIDDFANPKFRLLLKNAVAWTLEK